MEGGRGPKAATVGFGLGRHFCWRPLARRNVTAGSGWSHPGSDLQFSPNPFSVPAAAPQSRPPPPRSPPARLPRQPSPLTGLALAGRVQVVVRAQQLALAIGPAVVHARGQESAQPHLSRRVPAPHVPAHMRAVVTCGPGQATTSLSQPRPAPPRSAHRGPTPHRERRVRNQVPVCGKGIRSLATLEVALTERRKPARDS